MKHNKPLPEFTGITSDVAAAAALAALPDVPDINAAEHNIEAYQRKLLHHHHLYAPVTIIYPNGTQFVQEWLDEDGSL